MTARRESLADGAQAVVSPKRVAAPSELNNGKTRRRLAPAGEHTEKGEKA